MRIFSPFKFASTLALASVMTLLSSSCDKEGDDEASRGKYPEVSVPYACQGIFNGDPADEIRHHAKDGKIYEVKPRTRIEEEAGKSLDGSAGSNTATICKIYEGFSESDSLIGIDFRRESGPPPILKNSTKEEDVYTTENKTLIREKDDTVRFDTLCRIPDSTGGLHAENNIHLFMEDEIGLSTEVRVRILASAAEKASAGLGCTNYVKLPKRIALKKLPEAETAG